MTVDPQPTRGLLDTSVFIASESGRQLDVASIPDEVAVSVVTMAELEAGVLAAQDVPTRARRLATLESLADLEVLPIDRDAARAWAAMRVQLAEQGLRMNVNHLWIAAVAASHGLPVVTQDDDFAAVEAQGVTVVRV